MTILQTMLGKTSKRPWVSQTIEGEELEKADEVAKLFFD